jgi:hypothetical protein
MQNLCTDYQNLCEEFKTQFAMTTSQHAKCRLQQRAINPWAIEQIMKHGEIIYKQGMKFMYMPKKLLKLFYAPNLQVEIQDIMILVSNDGTVITAYRNENAVKHVQKKSKRLSKYRKMNNAPSTNNNTFQFAA